MDAKQIFAILLTVLGISGLIYTGVQIMNSGDTLKNLAVIGILAILFFSSGIRLLYSVRK
jgi:uncharacterized membrane protein